MSRIRVRSAVNRDISAVGGIEIGVDVARFGDDKTVMYKRHGLKVIERRAFRGQDVIRTAQEAWDMAGHRPSIPIKVDDTGVGGGVTDLLRLYGARVVPIPFSGAATDPDKYPTVIDEMWFTFPIDEADIPCNNDLIQELTGRRYGFDNKARRKIEPKAEFKKRYSRSPDDADALLLCFYSGYNLKMSEKVRNQMRARRG
jgi:phage terminase large subunit